MLAFMVSLAATRYGPPSRRMKSTVTTTSGGGGYKATLFRAHGRDVGYAEKDGRDGLIWGRSIVLLKLASPLDQPPETPSTFTLLLADWSTIQQGSQRFLCVNFNFDGLGRSGSFQKVHGLYLMRIPPHGKSKPALFYGVRR